MQGEETEGQGCSAACHGLESSKRLPSQADPCLPGSAQLAPLPSLPAGCRAPHAITLLLGLADHNDRLHMQLVRSVGTVASSGLPASLASPASGVKHSTRASLPSADGPPRSSDAWCCISPQRPSGRRPTAAAARAPPGGAAAAAPAGRAARQAAYLGRRQIGQRWEAGKRLQLFLRAGAAPAGSPAWRGPRHPPNPHPHPLHPPFRLTSPQK